VALVVQFGFVAMPAQQPHTGRGGAERQGVGLAVDHQQCPVAHAARQHDAVRLRLRQRLGQR
jgi:hypothetical protein